MSHSRYTMRYKSLTTLVLSLLNCLQANKITEHNCCYPLLQKNKERQKIVPEQGPVSPPKPCACAVLGKTRLGINQIKVYYFPLLAEQEPKAIPTCLLCDSIPSFVRPSLRAETPTSKASHVSHATLARRGNASRCVATRHVALEQHVLWHVFLCQMWGTCRQVAFHFISSTVLGTGGC